MPLSKAARFILRPSTRRAVRLAALGCSRVPSTHGRSAARFLKGRWRGFAAYMLTLEERATCPTTCRHLRSCYGNKMHLAQRMQAGSDLEWRLVREVALLHIDHPDGFAVRLHELGDFYSVEYVELWGRLLERYPGLHIWGYTAHTDGPIFAALVALVKRYGGRFA